MHYYNLFVHFYFVKTVHSYFIIFIIGSYKQFNEEDTKYYIHIFDYREENYINKELIEKISLLERKGLEFQPTWEVYSIEGYLKM